MGGRKVHIGGFVRCRQNVMLMTRMADWATRNGWTVVGSPGQADAVIYCPCGFDGDRSGTSRTELREAVFGTAGDVPVLVAGCSEGFAAEFAGMPRVSVLRHDAVARADEVLSPAWAAGLPLAGVNPHLAWPALTNDAEYVTAHWHVVAGHGCANRCSYCRIKPSKGCLGSKPLDAVAGEVADGVRLGYRSIALLTDDLGSWGLDLGPGTHLGTLLDRLGEVAPHARLHIHYVFPGRFLDHFEAILRCAEAGRIAYVCIPIQHTSPRILARMNRRYDADRVLAGVAELKARAPDTFVLNHLIVGYPGETREEFLHALDHGTRRHDETFVFRFCPHEGTPACDQWAQDPIPDEEMAWREERVRERFEQHGTAFLAHGDHGANRWHRKRTRRRLRVGLVRLGAGPAGLLPAAGIASLARYAQERADVDVITADAAFRPDLLADGCAEIARWDVDVLGIGAQTGDAEALRDAYEALTDGIPHIVIGGPAATAAPDDVTRFPKATFVLGEGEQTFVELLDAFAHGRPADGIPGIAYARDGRAVRTAPRPLLDSSAIPAPLWCDLSGVSGRMRLFGEQTVVAGEPRGAVLATSRGGAPGAGPGRDAFGAGVRRRPVADVVSELRMLAELGAGQVFLADDVLISDREHFGELMDAIAALGLGIPISAMGGLRADEVTPGDLERMWRAGVRHVCLPIGTAAPRLGAMLGATPGASSGAPSGAPIDAAKAREAWRIAAGLGFLVETRLAFGLPTATEEELIRDIEVASDENVHGFLATLPDLTAIPDPPGGARPACPDERLAELSSLATRTSLARLSTTAAVARLAPFGLAPDLALLEALGGPPAPRTTEPPPAPAAPPTEPAPRPPDPALVAVARRASALGRAVGFAACRCESKCDGMEAAYERPGGSLTVWVVPETAASRFVAATRRYRIGYSGDASTEGVVLCRAFAELIRKHEGGGAP